jgi:hypothetical protein
MGASRCECRLEQNIRRVGGGSKFVSERVFRAEGYIVKTRFTPPLLNNISVENECSLSELALAQLLFRVLTTHPFQSR